MFSKLTSSYCLNKNKFVFLQNKDLLLFSNNHNLGIFSDEIVDSLQDAYNKISVVSYTTKVLVNESLVVRDDNSLIFGNRISKQELDGKVCYYYLILKNSRLIKKILIK